MAQHLSEDDLTTPEGRFAANLRRLRLRAGIRTQQELADKLGVAQKAVSHWEVGRQRPGTLAMEFLLSDALGVAITDLYGDWLRSDDPAKWPIDLEVYGYMRDVQDVALDVVRRLPDRAPVTRLVQDVLVLDRKPVGVTEKLKAEAVEQLQEVLPKRTDPAIARYLVRKLREA